MNYYDACDWDSIDVWADGIRFTSRCKLAEYVYDLMWKDIKQEVLHAYYYEFDLQDIIEKEKFPIIKCKDYSNLYVPRMIKI